MSDTIVILKIVMAMQFLGETNGNTRHADNVEIVFRCFAVAEFQFKCISEMQRQADEIRTRAGLL